MKYPAIPALLLSSVLCAQAPVPSQNDAGQLATRMLQLMESTAVAVTGLVHASEPLKQNAEGTLKSLQRTPRNPAITYQLINQVKAYLALSDSIPRPNPFPEAADQQFSELRLALQRFQQDFEAALRAQDESNQAREADQANLKRYADADTKVLPPGNLPRVVFFGDSITDFWRLNEYFTGRDFINRGISGQTTLQMLGRFPQDVASLHPKAVLILAGTNDIARGIAPGAIEDNLAMMGELAKVHGIKAMFASILPVSDYHKDVDPRYEMTKTRSPAVILQVNKWMKDFCGRQGFIYVDYYTAMADTNGQMPRDLADDGLHPNAKGYRIMSPVALAAIDRELAAIPPESEAKQPAKRRFRMLGK